MNKPDDFNYYISPIVKENSSNEKKWATLYCSNHGKTEKHPIMNNFEILKEENEILKTRVDELEKLVANLIYSHK